MEIPHLSFLAVPVLDTSVRRVSRARDDNDDDEGTPPTVSESLSSAARRSRQANSGSQRKRRKPGDDSSMVSSIASAAHAAPVTREHDEKKLKVFEDHLKAMEDIERVRMSHRAKRDQQVNHLSRELLDGQLKKLRRKRDRLMELVCCNSDENDDEQQLTIPTTASL